MHVIPALLVASLWPFVSGPPDVYRGHERQLQVRVPRLEAQAVIDGRLDEAAWASASVLAGFSQFSPLDGVPAADSTQVLVWYSPTAIHFGIRAFEQHGAVHATLANRDKITADDHVQILLGTFRDQRQATLFAVNPLGVQMDGTIVESGQALSAGFTGVIASRVPPDLSQDYVFTSKGRLTDYGYEVEIRIPFRSIKFQPTDVQAWDINVLRQVQHSGYEDSWAPALRDKPSFLAQGGSLEGLRGLERGLVLDLNPIVTQKVNGAPGAAGWSYDRDQARLGVNARWGVTNGLTLNGTVRPDFAEVESDAGQLVVDPRSALFFAEKRPFFLDGLEQFSVPSNLIYTRRIGQPIAAAKLTGKVANTQVAFLSAVDDPGAGATGPSENAVFNILRAQRDIGGQSRIGMAYTDRILGSTFNRMADIDARIVSGSYSANIQMAASVTKAALGTLDGPLWNTSFTRSGKTFGLRYYFSGIDPDFQAASGFISRSGIVRAGVDHIWKWFGPRGATVEGFSLDVLYDDIWQYRRFVRRGDAQDKKFHVSTSTTVRGGWIVGASIFWETFGFDERFYSNYSIERTVGTTVDTIPFIGVPRIPNRDYVLALTTPRFSWGSGNFFWVWGQDENFFEWAQADINFLSASASLRPSAQMRVDGSLSYQDFRRRTDGSIVGKSMIPRVKLEYQLSRSIFVRAVGEYQTSERDDLRDETRTFFPLLINGKRALAFRSAGFTGEYLFSYLPHPGTVVFLGYGSQAEAIPDPADRFTYKPLVRDADHFFVKLSYLFRM